MNWNRATGVECASAGCIGTARWSLVAGGVASDYCDGCRSRITGEPDMRDARIAKLEAAIAKVVSRAESKGMGQWSEFIELRKALAIERLGRKG